MGGRLESLFTFFTFFIGGVEAVGHVVIDLFVEDQPGDAVRADEVAEGVHQLVRTGRALVVAVIVLVGEVGVRLESAEAARGHHVARRWCGMLSTPTTRSYHFAGRGLRVPECSMSEEVSAPG